jgi:plasmid rolling circle replication initiator protein Rep
MCPNSSIYSDEKSRVLVDKTKSGKVRPWREKKIANVDYFELLHILEFKKAERVKRLWFCCKVKKI